MDGSTTQSTGRSGLRTTGSCMARERRRRNTQTGSPTMWLQCCILLHRLTLWDFLPHCRPMPLSPRSLICSGSTPRPTKSTSPAPHLLGPWKEQTYNPLLRVERTRMRRTFGLMCCQVGPPWVLLSAAAVPLNTRRSRRMTWRTCPSPRILRIMPRSSLSGSQYASRWQVAQLRRVIVVGLLQARQRQGSLP